MVPFFLKSSGDAYKSGKIQGKECKDIIFDFTKNLTNLPSLRLGSNNLLTKLAFNFELFFNYFRQKPLIEKVLNYQAEKIRGISDGSGIDLKMFYLLNASEIFSSLLKYGTYNVVIGIEPSRMENRELVIYRNYSYYKQLEESQIVRLVEPEKRFKTLDFTLSPLIGTISGINEHSLSIFYNFVLANYKKNGLPASLVIQEVLERCKNVEEALGFLEASSISEPGNLILSDRGKIIGVEIGVSGIEILYPEDGILILANHFTSPKMKKYNLKSNVPFPLRYLVHMSAKSSLGESQGRYEKVKNLLTKKEKISLEDLKVDLSKHMNSSSNGSYETRGNGIYNLLTGIVIIFPLRKQLLVSTNDLSVYASYSFTD